MPAYSIQASFSGRLSFFFFQTPDLNNEGCESDAGVPRRSHPIGLCLFVYLCLQRSWRAAWQLVIHSSSAGRGGGGLGGWGGAGEGPMLCPPYKGKTHSWIFF